MPKIIWNSPWNFFAPERKHLLRVRDTGNKFHVAFSISLATNLFSNLTHSFPVHPFSTSRKHQKTLQLSCFQGVEKGCTGNEWVNETAYRHPWLLLPSSLTFDRLWYWMFPSLKVIQGTGIMSINQRFNKHLGGSRKKKERLVKTLSTFLIFR